MTDKPGPSIFMRLTAPVYGLALLCSLITGHSWAQTPVPKPSATTPVITASNTWASLSPRQKQALHPLAGQWGQLTPQQQSKWLAISQNYSQMSAAEQATLHARMSDWAALSPQQRNQARFNFNTLQNLPKEDKKAKWDAYQALSAEDRRLLSAGSPQGPAKTAAPSAKPVNPERLITPPLRSAPDTNTSLKSAAQPIDRKTLLPKPTPIAPASPAVPNDIHPIDPPISETAPS